MKIYLIGIGGAAAAYLVDLALQSGYKVSGSDAIESQTVQRLQNRGIKINIPHCLSCIDSSVDQVWYSTAITEQSASYIELEKARNLGIPTYNFAQAAANYFNRAKIRIGIAGAHGKTTTTAMVGWICQKSGFEPTVALGGYFKPWSGNALIGKNDYFVIEADEYAKRFLEYNPTHSIVTNIDHDHFDTYPTKESYVQAFRHYLSQTSDVIVGWADDPDIRFAAEGSKARIIDYGLRHGSVCLDEKGIVVPYHLPIKLRAPGDHFLLDALAALALTVSLGIEPKMALAALADFPGVDRRFEYLGLLDKRIMVFDDFGHHPTEIKAVLQGARSRYPNQPILLIHQPHQANRLAHLMTETAKSLESADRIILLPVYQVEGREVTEDVELATSQRLAALIGDKAEVVSSNQEAVELAKSVTKDWHKGLIFTIGATDVWKIGAELIKNNPLSKLRG